ncbi:MAG: phage terminase large subunit [bacterium]
MTAVEQLWSLPLPVLRSIRAELGPAEFASDDHRAFFDSHDPEIVLSGWMGAGKSRVLCEKAWWLARTYPGATFGLFRKVHKSLEATTERTFWRDVAVPSLIAKRNKSEGWVELVNGSRIYFMGLDPDPVTGVPSKVGSLDLAWAGVDEAVELGEGDWIMLLGRLRDPRMPWHQLAAATNPGPPKHWLRIRFSESGRTMLFAKHNKFLQADYLAMLAGLPDTAQGRRLGRGEWAAAEGMIYEFPDAQVCSPAPETAWKRVIAGVDWGFVHAFACEVIGQSGSGRLAVLDEVYERGTLLDTLIPRLRNLVLIHKVEVFYADPSEPEYIAACRRAGLPMQPATNDVLPGIDAVGKAIGDGMTIDPRCSGLLGELPGYTWLQNKGMGGGLKEQPLKMNDDACDALRYAVMGLTPGQTATSSSYMPSTTPPIIRRGDLVLVGERYQDREPGR